jgi:hypothetical protein
MLTQRAIDIIVTEELAADMRKAEAEAVRRGLLHDYEGDGTLELTEAGERYLFELIASSQYTSH